MSRLLRTHAAALTCPMLQDEGIVFETAQAAAWGRSRPLLTVRVELKEDLTGMRIQET